MNIVCKVGSIQYQYKAELYIILISLITKKTLLLWHLLSKKGSLGRQSETIFIVIGSNVAES